MKSIQDFLSGKLRRMEAQNLRLIAPGTAHPDLGLHQGTLLGPGGALAFYERGIVLADGRSILYEAIERVVLERPAVQIITSAGVQRLNTSAEGGEAVFAALRWIGNVILRRKIA